jgi:hypothetical protein
LSQSCPGGPVVVRSLLAMLAGCGVIIVLVVMANAVVFHGASLEGPPEIPLQIILLAMGALAAVVGGYVAAAIGRRHHVAHGIALGAVLVAARVAMLVRGQFDMGLPSEPRWFALAVLAVGLGGATLGGMVRSHVAQPESAQA